MATKTFPVPLLLAILFFGFAGPSAFAQPETPGVSDRPGWYEGLHPWLSQIPNANPGIQSEKVRGISLEAYADAADALPDPMVGIGVQAVPTDFDLTREGMTQAPALTLRQVIPWPGKLAARRKLLQAEGKTAGQTAAIEQEAEGLRLAQAAFSLKRIQTELEAVDEGLAWLSLLFDSADARYRSGLGAGYDVDQIVVEIGRLKSQKSRLSSQLRQARATWREVLGTDAPLVLEMGHSPAWTPAWPVTDVVKKENPGVRMAGLMQRMAEEKVGLEKSDYGPDLTAELGYGVRYQDRNDFITARVGVSVPLWAPWSHRNEVEGARQAVRSRALELSDMQREAEAMAERTLADLDDARHREALYRESIIPSAAQARESAQSAYGSGGQDIFVPIESIRRHLEAVREAARIAAERQILEARLLGLAGRLVQQTEAE